MIPKGRQGTRNLERRGSVAYFSSLSQDTGVSSYFSSRLPLWAAIFYTKLHAWTPKGNHTTLPGINATERCQTCDRVIFVIFTSYLWRIIQPSIKTAIPNPVKSSVGWISWWMDSGCLELINCYPRLEYEMFKLLVWSYAKRFLRTCSLSYPILDLEQFQ